MRQSRIAEQTASAAEAHAIDVKQLHDRCGVYTQPALVRRTLDACGWTRNVDLSGASLLEPCAGDGSFLVEAVRRLMQSLKRHRRRPSSRLLRPRILAYELMPAEADKARASVAAVLCEFGTTRRDALAVTKDWIKTGDFLIDGPKGRRFSSVVGNPPYVRWSRVPAQLREKYEKALPSAVARGDLQLPFLNAGVDALATDGKLSFVCSDRWRHMEYGATFKASLFEKTLVKTYPIEDKPPFSRRVDAYADLLVITNTPPSQAPVRRLNISRQRSLAELGCRVKVGPALGFNTAFVGTLEELQIESELCAKFVRPDQIRDGEVASDDVRIIVMHDRDGNLRNLDRLPRLAAHLEKYSMQLRRRSIVVKGGVWYRPIDLVQRHVWVAPKLVLPEIAKTPRVALDRSGAIPSHAVYAILGPTGAIEDAYAQLEGAGLAKALDGLAPRIKGGYVRCYKRFLDMIAL